MGVLDKSVWRQRGLPTALRNIMKNCQTSICECLAGYMQRQMAGGDGMGQTWDNMTNEFARRSGMAGHWEKSTNLRGGNATAQAMWVANGCGGGSPAPHTDWATMRDRTQQNALDQYGQTWGQPMPAGEPAGRSMLSRVGYAAAGTVLAVGAGVGLAFIFDGPASEAVLGTASLAAFGLAFE